jgi:cell division protease FtsH
MNELQLHVSAEVGTLDERGRVPVSITPAAVRVLLGWQSDQSVKAIHEASHSCISAVLRGAKSVKTIDIKNKYAGCSILDAEDDEQPSFVSASAYLDLIVIALAGREGEILILGEPTNGNASDISEATKRAKQRFEAGMDLTALAGGVDTDYFSPLPTALGEALLSSMIETMTTARERARVLVAEHRDQIVALARIVYEARRLSDDALTAAFREIGLDPDKAPASAG